MERPIKLFPWFLIINIASGCFGFNIGVFLSRYVTDISGAVAGILAGWITGWIISIIVVTLFTSVFQSFRNGASIPSQVVQLLSISISWSIVWASLPAMVSNNPDISTLLAVIGVLLMISILQFFLIRRFIDGSVKIILWGNLTGALIFMFAVIILAFLRVSDDNLFGYIVWGVAIGVGSALMLSRDLQAYHS